MLKRNGHKLLVTAALLCGCAGTPYRPFEDGVGFSDVNIAKNKYEIMFHGTRDEDELDAKRYAIVRAAEIGRMNNFAYFRVANERDHEVAEKETIKESNTENYRQPYTAFPGEKTWRRKEKTVTRVENRPVVKLVVQYQNEDCNDCLSVDQKIKEGVESGILKR